MCENAFAIFHWHTERWQGAILHRLDECSMIVARKSLYAICGRDAVKVAADSSGRKTSIGKQSGMR